MLNFTDDTFAIAGWIISGTYFAVKTANEIFKITAPQAPKPAPYYDLKSGTFVTPQDNTKFKKVFK